MHGETYRAWAPRLSGEQREDYTHELFIDCNPIVPALVLLAKKL